jgi:hypothetical protein
MRSTGADEQGNVRRGRNTWRAALPKNERGSTFGAKPQRQKKKKKK